MKSASFRELLEFAIAEGATAPIPAAGKAWAWSTTLGKPVYWTGALWTAGASGGSTNPAGTTGQVQYNNNGAFGGAGNLTVVEGNLILNATTEPTTPPASSLTLYAKDLLPNQTVFKIKRPSGVDTPIQDGLAFNRFIQYRGSNNAIVAQGAGALTVVGTAAAVTPTSGSMKTQVQRVRYTSAATAGTLASAYAATAGLCPVMRGNVAGEGGFRIVMRFSLQTLVAGVRGFFGLRDVITAPANTDPLAATAPAGIGLAFNLNTGNWRIRHNVTGSAPTVINLGANFPIDVTSHMELVLFCPPHNGTTAGNISYRVRRYTTSSADPAFEDTGTITTNVPTATTLLHITHSICNNTTASAVAYEYNQTTIESDS